MNEKSSLLDQSVVEAKQLQKRAETKQAPFPPINYNDSTVPTSAAVRKEQLLEIPPTPTASIQKLHARSFLRNAASTGLHGSGAIMGSFDGEDELGEVLREDEKLIDMANLEPNGNIIYETNAGGTLKGGNTELTFSNSLSASANAISSLFEPSSETSTRSSQREDLNNVGRAQHAVSNLFGSSLLTDGSSRELNVSYISRQRNQEDSSSIQLNKVDTSESKEHHSSYDQERKINSHQLSMFTSIFDYESSVGNMTDRRKTPLINSKMNPVQRIGSSTASETPSLLDEAMRIPQHSSGSAQTYSLPTTSIHDFSPVIDGTCHTSERKLNLSSHKNASNVARSWFGGNLDPGLSEGIQRRSRKPLSKPQDSSLGVDLEYSKQGIDENASCSSNVDKVKLWNGLNLALSLSYGFTTAASVVPITLIPTIAIDILSRNEYQNGDDDDQLLDSASTFASTVTMYAVLGTAFGKFLNGPIGDIFGARRIACMYAFFLSSSLLILSLGNSSWSIIFACAAVEYYQSVQWPCVAVILAAHYGNPIEPGSVETKTIEAKHLQSAGAYETGIYVTSLGSRCGALLASLSTTMLLRFLEWGWRAVARLASLGSFIGLLIMYLFVTDSPGRLHHPQNPLKEDISYHGLGDLYSYTRSKRKIITSTDLLKKISLVYKVGSSIFLRNIVPSLRSLLSNGTFWVVAVAHSGGLMVCTSVRILGTYFRDTSYGTISENEAGAVTIFLSVGILVGLAVGGSIFANLSNNSRGRKDLVSKLYIVTVIMCYALSILATPFVRSRINSPSLVAILQAVATFCMGASVAVQVYCIPAIVGCTFGANKGLFAAYTDGVASIVSSLVWRIVGNAVAEGNPQGAGWAYGWAAVALLVILAGFLMVEFVEHYFCRKGWMDRAKVTKNKHNTVLDEDKILQSKSFSGSVSDLAQSGKKIWEKTATFRSPSRLIKRHPDVESILSSYTEDSDDISTVAFEHISSNSGFNGFGNARNSSLARNANERKSRLLDLECNKMCADCRNPFPRWVAIIARNRLRANEQKIHSSIGSFICTECAGSHRKLGTHIVFVRSIDHDTLKEHELRSLEEGGNFKVNKMYEALLTDTSRKLSNTSTSIERMTFINQKYGNRRWLKVTRTNQNTHASSPESFQEEDKSTLFNSIEMVQNKQLLQKSNEEAMTGSSHAWNTYSKEKEFGNQTARFDRQTRDQYKSFIEQEDEYDAKDSPSINDFIDEYSVASNISDGDSIWHISDSGNGGLADTVHL